MFIHDRHRQLINALTPDAVTSVETLSTTLSVSTATVRRDLGELSKEGRLKRVRGGAVAVSDSGARTNIGATRTFHDLAGQAEFEQSLKENKAAKRAIGKAAAAMVDVDDTIIIDGGSTTFEMARQMDDRPLTVLTTSIPILFALYGRPGIRVMIPGGEAFPKQNIVLNPYANDLLERFSASKLFIGAQSVTDQGLMQTDPLLVQNEQQLIRRADAVILMATSDKFERRGSLSVCSLSTLDIVVTDDKLPRHSHDMLTRHGVRVIVAKA